MLLLNLKCALDGGLSIMQRARFLVTGVVQGVGFRPFCARLARLEKLTGSVKNTPAGVELDLFGEPARVTEFLRRLERECPTAAYIHAVSLLERLEVSSEIPNSFDILKSEGSSARRVLIPPDIATCDSCLEDMADNDNRRYRYPFTNCTLCGPRFSIVKDLPYDRVRTTMSKFQMCRNCAEEYGNASDRRYHAQPNACPACGPSLWICGRDGVPAAFGEEALSLSIDWLEEGRVMAIKGLGGFHLACDARSDGPIAILRSRKKRPHRPFAVMARDVGIAEKLVHLTEKGRDCLLSSRRPIVICQCRKDSGLSPGLNPEMDSLGVMLPYTPLHHLLLGKLEVLVMTSANMSEEPIIADNDQALDRLGPLVDGFLMHDRDICMRIDDSVVSVAGNRAFYVRRARGVVPQPFFLPNKGPSILAAGGEMKSTFSLTHEGCLFPSQYLGDLKELPATEYYREALTHFLLLYGMEPRFLVHDLHPLYLSTRICRESLSIVEGTLAIQHHHAHLAACLFENRIEEPAVGLILDGTGYGTDGSVWGGEILWGDATGFERLGHLLPFSLPGGERAVRNPWRSAIALAKEAVGLSPAMDLLRENWPELGISREMLAISIEAGVPTTSCGRLFDGVSSILGFGGSVSYDGQAPMRMEAAARGSGALPFAIVEHAEKVILDWKPAIRTLLEKRHHQTASFLSAAFHGGLALALAEAAEWAAVKKGTRKIALSGGVWQNRRLFRLVIAHLKGRGLEPIVHSLLSPNDECVSVGQAIAGHLEWK